MAKIIKVIRQNPTLVVPSKPTKTEVKQLSDIDDQQGLRSHVYAIMSFKPNKSKELHPAKGIKQALSRALVYYYPLAGRLLKSRPDGKLMVHCNGEGVMFIEADAEVTLKEIQPHILPPCPLLKDFLFDVPGSQGITNCPILLFQVTRLSCGGHIMGIRYSHCMCDMSGLLNLLQAMTELSRDEPKPSVMPVWDRELLTSGHVPTVTCRHHEYEQVESKDYEYSKEGSNMVQGSFYFDPKQVQSIRNLFSTNIQNSSTTFDLICACILRCRTIALKPDPEETITFSMLVNFRGKKIINLPKGYYGNALVTPGVTAKAKELLRENSWAYALKLVMESKEKANEEYVKSMIDYMAINGRPKYAKNLHFMAVNLPSLEVSGLDFGWGAPLYFGVARAYEIQSVFMKVKNGKGENVRLVSMLLPTQVMLRLQHELGKIMGEPFGSLTIDSAHISKL